MKRGPSKKLEGQYIITEVAPDGEPIAPEAAAKKFIRQSGCIVRDYIQISFRLWKAYNPSEQMDAVPEREKEWCWWELKKNFTVPAESEEILKHWTLSKMAEQLQSFKKTLTKKYIKTGTTPVLTGELEKLKDHWDAFVQYKTSELGIEKVQKAKDNASKKVYHHTLGQGGYKLAIPKWEKMEQDLLDRGIQPATMNWPERSRTWFYGHGGSLVSLTGAASMGQTSS